MKQTILLSLPKAERALNSKEELEALSFAVLIKLTFTTSEVQSATVRRCKEIFGIGSTRMSRVINNSIKYGYVVRIGNNLKALPVKEENAFNIKLRFECKTFSRSEERYSLNEIMDIIRDSVFLNHIKKQNACENTFRLTDNPKTCKGFKAAQKRIKRMSHTSKAFVGLSMTKIANLLSVSKWKARKLLSKLLSCGFIEKIERSIKVPFNPSELSNRLREWFQESGYFGYLYRGKDGVYCRVSNSYSYNCDVIQWKKSF